MSHYIQFSDITDNVIKGFGDTGLLQPYDYYTEADNEINDLAVQNGIMPTQISTPLHYKLKRYGVVHLCMRVAQDNMGVNNVEMSPDMDKYTLKFAQYRKELADLRTQIRANMFVVERPEQEDFSQRATNSVVQLFNL